MSSFVQGNTAVATGATSGTVTLGSAPGSGHLLVIFRFFHKRGLSADRQSG